jgi:hypothetical protein
MINFLFPKTINSKRNKTSIGSVHLCRLLNMAYAAEITSNTSARKKYLKLKEKIDKSGRTYRILVWNVVLRSRMRQAIPPFPQYDFMAWCSVEGRSTRNTGM